MYIGVDLDFSNIALICSASSAGFKGIRQMIRREKRCAQAQAYEISDATVTLSGSHQKLHRMEEMDSTASAVQLPFLFLAFFAIDSHSWICNVSIIHSRARVHLQYAFRLVDGRSHRYHDLSSSFLACEFTTRATHSDLAPSLRCCQLCCLRA